MLVGSGPVHKFNFFSVLHREKIAYGRIFAAYGRIFPLCFRFSTTSLQTT